MKMQSLNINADSMPTIESGEIIQGVPKNASCTDKGMSAMKNTRTVR
jgi:hypothetical protein